MKQSFLAIFLCSLIFNSSLGADVNSVVTATDQVERNLQAGKDVVASAQDRIDSGIDRVTGSVSASKNTSTVELSASDIARMEKEASGAQSSGSGGGRFSSFVTSVKKAVTDPLQSLYKVVKPLGYFVIGFFSEMANSFKKADYMDSAFTISVNPTAYAERRMAEDNGETDSDGWEVERDAEPVGITYDFGFEGAGEADLPIGFIKVHGRYYYRPVTGKMQPSSMKLGSRTYPVSLYKRPFSILLPKLLQSMVGAQEAGVAWASTRRFGRLNPQRIFMFKSILLLMSAIRNSMFHQERKIDDQGQVYTRRSFGYKSEKDGARYPGMNHIHTEFSNMVRRLKITPDIARTVELNNGEKYPSRWKPDRIVMIGDNPGAVFMTMLPSLIKELVDSIQLGVNAFEYQKLIDNRRRPEATEMQKLYGELWLTKGYKDKVEFAQEKLLTLNLSTGKHSFTDLVRYLYALKRLLHERYQGLEFLVSQYTEPDNSLSDNEEKDLSTSDDAHITRDGYYQEIDIKKLMDLLVKRTAALASYIDQLKGFLGRAPWGVAIKRYYEHVATEVGRKLEEDENDPQSMYHPGEQFEFITRLAKSVMDDAREKEMNLEAELSEFQDKVNAVEGASGEARLAALDNLIQLIETREESVRDVALYPAGMESSEMPRVTLPGTKYIAHALDLAAYRHEVPFEGDPGYFYDVSMLDEFSAYMHLLAILYRSSSDLERAADMIRSTEGPLELVADDGKIVPVSNGKQFYIDNLTKYEVYYFKKERAFRQAREGYGDDAAQTKDAFKAFDGAQRLLRMARRRMNNYLKKFAFDRRRGVARDESGKVLDEGIIGHLDDGDGNKKPVYGYERTVEGFLLQELPRFALRSRMLDLKDLQELMFATTGLKPAEVVRGVEAQKRQQLKQQQEMALGDDEFSELLGEEGPEGVNTQGVDDELAELLEGGEGFGDLDAELMTNDDLGEFGELDVMEGLPGVVASEGSVEPAVIDPVSAESASGPVEDPFESEVIAAAAAPVATGASSAVQENVSDQADDGGALPTATLSDVENAYNSMSSGGQVSYNEGDGYTEMVEGLVSLLDDFKGAERGQDVEAYGEAMNGTLALIAGGKDPSPQVKLKYVDLLERGVQALKLTTSDVDGVADTSAHRNMATMLRFLKSGVLSEYSAQIDALIGRISTWTKI